MDKIVLFNTAIGSQNKGDYIIVKCAKEELGFIIDKGFVTELPTHTPNTHFYQQFKRNSIIDFTDKADYKFALGTNLLAYNQFSPWPNFNINIFNSRTYKNIILVGVGLNPNSHSVNLYTKILFKKILSNDYIHSTRDEKTKIFLENLGFRAINTSCVTMWKLTPEFCLKIPATKSKNVIFTLTDYCKDREKDQILINFLIKNYDKVFFWIQGSNDLDYLNSLDNIDDINLVYPSLEEYEKILEMNSIEYVGTRLHAGIFALRHKKRSIIISIDNRTRDIKNSYNILTIERDKIETLQNVIYSDLSIDIKLPMDSIKKWKEQFQ